jgi:GH25 family lysozyme M1 (1,4-beta-N-acetylmuramidase)
MLMRKCRSFLSQIEILESRRLLTNAMGVDAAGSYQYLLNWATIKADGYTFGWEKATQGTGGDQSLYASNVSAAKAAGVAIGAYCFAEFNEDPTATANDFWNEIKSTVSGDGLTLQPMLDAESYNPTGMNLDSWVATWSSVLKADGAAAGVTLNPIIYSDTSFADDYFTTATSKVFPLWIADPGSTAPTNSHTAPWTSYEVWQYGEATFPSSNGNVATNVATDVDQLNGDSTELQNLIIGTGKFPDGTSVETNTSAKALQNYNGSGTSSNVPASTKGTVLSGPQYYNNAWYFDVSFTDGISGWVTETSTIAVAGPPATPTNSSPASGTTVYSAPDLTWNTDATAATYNVYINNSEVASGLTTTSYQTSSSLTAGTYNWYIQAVNSSSSTNGASWSFTLSDPVAPTYTAPANNATDYNIPTFSWNASTGATSYNVFLNNSKVASNLAATSYTPSTLSLGTYSWYVQAVSNAGTTNGSTWTLTYALPIPVASYASQVPTTGASVLDFSVGYSDPAVSINTRTFDSNDVTVTGPNGYSQNATFISQSQPGNGPSRSATYEITAPNGVWNILANGTYTVTMNANQVADTSGSYVVAGTLGTFTVSAPFAYISTSSQLILNATSSYPNISFSKSGSLWNASNGNTNIQFNPLGYTSVDFLGTSGNDSLAVYSAMAVPLSFNGGSGQDALNLYAGTLTFASDLGATTSALTLSTYDTARVNFSSSQHLAGLDLYNNSVVALTAGAGIAIETQDLEINDAASVDVADDALVVYNNDPDTMTSYLESGFDEGAWDGPGINSHVAAANLGETVGFAPATSLSYTSINGVSFSSTAIVVRYTYTGDANLDGTVNADDLSLLALSAAQQQTAQTNNQPAPTVYWYNGDFNYDGTINSDDFLLLSLGSAVQNQQTLG